MIKVFLKVLFKFLYLSDIFDFELSNDDLSKIEKLDTGKPSFIHNEEFGKQLLSWIVPE